MVLALLASGCPDPKLEVITEQADEYIRGIQYADPPDVLRRLAAFRQEIASRPQSEWPEIRERYIDLVKSRFADYDSAKTSGEMAIHDDGISLIRALALGKGIFYGFEEVRLRDGARAVGVMTAVPDYSPRRFELMPSRATVYLMGEPLGAIHAVTLGKDPEERTLRVVTHVAIEWNLVWFDQVDIYPEGWAVESVLPITERFEFSDLTRAF